MYDSGIKASRLIADTISETDVWIDIPMTDYLGWIDEVEQLLYSEIIKETATYEKSASVNTSGEVDLNSVSTDGESDKPRFDDIYAVYADGVQLIHTEGNVGHIFPDCYWKDGGNLKYRLEKAPSKLTIYYFVRPKLKTSAGGDQKTIKLPPEWVGIIRAKLRGEAYKVVNEDNQAAKWINDYNILIQQFTQYMSARKPELGGYRRQAWRQKMPTTN